MPAWLDPIAGTNFAFINGNAASDSNDRANEERQQRQLVAGLALEAILFAHAPFPNVGDVDFDHRPRVRRRVLAFDHALGDDAARLRERNERARNRLRVGGGSRSSGTTAGALPEAARRATGSAGRNRRARRGENVVGGHAAVRAAAFDRANVDAMLARQTPYGRRGAAQRALGSRRPSMPCSACAPLGDGVCAGSGAARRPARLAATGFAQRRLRR